MADALNLPAYMKRIGFDGELKPDLATLTALQAAHVRGIPFESLDPFLRRPVSLDLAALQDKLIASPRGGYCFELNALFKAALEAIGFSVTGLAGRVLWMSPPGAPLGPREHMILKVQTIDGPHLVDVGFGACLLDAPLPLAVNQEFQTPLGVYRLTETQRLYRLAARRGEDWRTLYAFDLEPQLPADYELGNWYTSTSPVPPFQHVLIIERIVDGARRKIVNRRYIVEGRDGVVESERAIESSDDMERLLEDVFGIVPPVTVAELFERTPQ